MSKRYHGPLSTYTLTTYTLSGVEQVWYFMGGAEKRHKKVSGERLPVDSHAFVILTHVHWYASGFGKADFGGPFCFVRYRVTSQ